MWETFQRFGTFEEYKDVLYKKRVSTGYKRLKTIKKGYRQEYFEKYKASLLEIKQEEFFDDFYENIGERRRTIYDAVIYNETYDEAILTVKNHDLEKSIDKLRQKNYKLESSIRQNKKITDRILNSRSWKITKPLRGIRNIFR